MDMLTFIAEMTKALAWPILVLFLVVLLWKHIVALIPGLRRVKLGMVEAEFERRLLYLAGDVDVSAETPTLGTDVSRVGEIMLAWNAVEASVLEFAKEMDLSHRSAKDALDRLEGEEFVSPETVAAVEELRQLRNLAAHGRLQRVPKAEARTYVRTARSLVRRIEILRDAHVKRRQDPSLRG